MAAFIELEAFKKLNIGLALDEGILVLDLLNIAYFIFLEYSTPEFTPASITFEYDSLS